MDADYYDRPQCTTTTSIANTMYYMMPFFGILAILPVDTKFRSTTVVMIDFFIGSAICGGSISSKFTPLGIYLAAPGYIFSEY